MLASHIFVIRGPGLRLVTACLEFVVWWLMIRWCLNGLAFYCSILAKINDTRTSRNYIRCDAQPMSCSTGFSSVFITFTGFQLRLQLGWVQSIPQTRALSHIKCRLSGNTGNMLSLSIKVKVNTNKIIFMMEWDFQEARHNQPSWTDSTLMLIYIFSYKKAPYVTELYIGCCFWTTNITEWTLNVVWYETKMISDCWNFKKEISLGEMSTDPL